MKNEKIAAIGLALIIAGTLSVYLWVTYGDDILDILNDEDALGEFLAKDDTFVYYKNSSFNVVNVLSNDIWPSADYIMIYDVTQPSHGTVSFEGSTISYAPDVNFTGSDSFVYSIIDEHNRTSSARVYITVEGKMIELGDSVDVHYILYIYEGDNNKTFYESSYSDVENKTGGTPVSIYVSLDENAEPPSGYVTGITGFVEGLLGLEQKQRRTIGPIPPEKAYGTKLEVGDIFWATGLAGGLNQTVEVLEYTDENLTLKWINLEDFGNFTMPLYIVNDLRSTDPEEVAIYPPVCYIWENSTQITTISDEEVTVFTTPTKSENLYEEFYPFTLGNRNGVILPDATTAEWNETLITLTSDPAIGSQYEYPTYLGFNLTYVVYDVTETHINMSYEYYGQVFYMEFNRTISFNRSFTMPRIYRDIPSEYDTIQYQQLLLSPDLDKQGLSIHELAGESLIFEVEIVEILKTS